MSNQKYSSLRIALHWFSALVILWTLVTGFYRYFFNPQEAFGAWISYVNVSVTTLLIPLFIWRLALLWISPAASVESRIVHVVHLVIYAVITLVLVTGVLMMNKPIEVFNWVTLANPVKDPAWQRIWMQVHIVACGGLAVLVLLHICAVIKHQLAGRSILRKMWFQ